MTSDMVGTVTHDSGVLRDAIRQILVEELELDAAEVRDDADFVEEYDADSLSLITVVARIERDLGIAVPRDELAGLTNLQKVFDAVERRAAEDAVE